MPEATEMQQMELDMVQGMYDTYELLSQDPPSYSVLLAASADDPPELKVTLTYPTEDYPESDVCAVDIENVSRNRRIQTAALAKEVAALCEENKGMHCAIIVLQHIQEFLTRAAQEEEKTNLQRRGEAMEAAAVARNGVVVDPTILVGTAVTRELFEEWSRHRAAERARVQAEKDKEVRVTASKLTGRQLWDNTLKSADWELFAHEAEEDDGVDVDFDAMRDLDEANYDLDEDVTEGA